MPKTKSKQADKKEYVALTNLSNGATGREFETGDTVTDADFPAEVITNWLEIDPPALEVKS